MQSNAKPEHFRFWETKVYLGGNLLKTKQVSNVVSLSVKSNFHLLNDRQFCTYWCSYSPFFLYSDIVSHTLFCLSIKILFHFLLLFYLYINLSNVFNALQYISYFWSHLENSQRDTTCSIQLFWSKSIVGSEAFSWMWSETWSNTF